MRVDCEGTSFTYEPSKKGQFFGYADSEVDASTIGTLLDYFPRDRGEAEELADWLTRTMKDR